MSGWRGGIRLHGDFKPGDYRLKFKSGLQTIDGGIFDEDLDLRITVPNRRARMNFLTDGRFVPRAAWGPLPLSHINIDKARLTIRHVPQPNLVQWLARGSNKVDALTSRVAARAELNFKNPANKRETTWINLSDHVPNPSNGLYTVSLRSQEAEAQLWLTVTDLNLVAKREKRTGSVLVTTVNAHSNRGLKGAHVQLVYRNGLMAGECITSKHGVCRINPLTDPLNPETPFALVAKYRSDTTYLKFSDLETLPTDSVTDGIAYHKDTPIEAPCTVTETLRPDEEIKLVGIIRDVALS